MADFSEIDEARRLLGLYETATLKRIKNTYRHLSRRYHPDKHDSESEETHEKIKSGLHIIIAGRDPR